LKNNISNLILDNGNCMILVNYKYVNCFEYKGKILIIINGVING